MRDLITRSVPPPTTCSRQCIARVGCIIEVICQENSTCWCHRVRIVPVHSGQYHNVREYNDGLVFISTTKPSLHSGHIRVIRYLVRFEGSEGRMPAAHRYRRVGVQCSNRTKNAELSLFMRYRTPKRVAKYRYLLG